MRGWCEERDEERKRARERGQRDRRSGSPGHGVVDCEVLDHGDEELGGGSAMAA